MERDFSLPLVFGETARRLALAAPALSPPSVISSGLPPKFRAFAFNHRIAWI